MSHVTEEVDSALVDVKVAKSELATVRDTLYLIPSPLSLSLSDNSQWMIVIACVEKREAGDVARVAWQSLTLYAMLCFLPS